MAEDPAEILKAARMLAEIELRDRVAKAAETQAADVRRIADILQQLVTALAPVLELAGAWLKSPGWAALARHIYDGMPPWARGLAGTAIVLTILGFSSTQMLEALKYGISYLRGDAPTVQAPAATP